MPPGVANISVTDSQVILNTSSVYPVSLTILHLTQASYLDIGNVFFWQIPLTGPNSIIGRAVVVHADTDDLGKGNASSHYLYFYCLCVDVVNSLSFEI
jgi:hypothetical protein